MTIITKEISEVTLSSEDPESFWNGDNLLRRDPYEASMVEIGRSLVAGAGEGIFLKQEVEADTVVAFYNGIRPMDTGSDDWEECAYRIFMRKEDAEDDQDDQDILDIPSHLRDVSQYAATLAHKVNHSFRPNCRFSDFHHPLHGLIRSVVTLQRLEAGAELYVHYNYSLEDCPDWYSALWENIE